MAAKQDWYYSKNSQQFGPIAAKELKRLAATGELSPDDLVRQKGSPQWRRAKTLKGLFASIRRAPVLPPLPQSSLPKKESFAKSVLKVIGIMMTAVFGTIALLAIAALLGRLESTPNANTPKQKQIKQQGKEAANEVAGKKATSEPAAHGTWGIIDKTGRLITPCRYTRLGRNGESESGDDHLGFGKFPIPADDGNGANKAGFVDRMGNTVIPLQFKNVTCFANELAAVQNADGSWGFIDSTGKWAIPPSFDDARPFASNGLAAVKKNGKWGFIAKSGDAAIPYQYTDAQSFRCNRASVSKGMPNPNGNGVIGGWGVIDEAGKEIVACEYLGILPYRNGHAIVMHSDNVFAQDQGSLLKLGIIDASGRFTLPIQNKPLERVIKHCDEHHHYDGNIDENDTEDDGASSDIFNLMNPNTTGSPTYSLIRPNGVKVFKTQSDVMCPFHWAGSSSRFIFSVPPNEKQMNLGVFDEKWWKFGYLNEHGELAIQSLFNDAKPFYEGVAAVKLGETWGFIDESGKTVVEPQFSDTGHFSEGFAPAKKGDLWGYIDRQGKWCVNPQYKVATSFCEGIAFVMAPVANGKQVRP